MSAAAFTLRDTAKVVRFNWPKYAAAILVLVGVAAARTGLFPGDPHMPTPGRGLVLIGGAAVALTAWWTVASLVATWWVYDHRRVYDLVIEDIEGTDVADGPGAIGSSDRPAGPVRWASIHAGFDDATLHFVPHLGGQPVAVIDLGVEGGASIRRARASQGRGLGPAAGVANLTRPLDLADASIDLLLLTFAAHEVRDPNARQALFDDVARVLAPGGRLVLTEHLVDAANLAVYGPGAFHFQPGRTWRHGAGAAGLHPTGETRLTPFVRRFTWAR